jgi:hypothetical protein
VNKSFLIVSIVFLAMVQPALAQTFRQEGVRIGAREFKDINGIRIGQGTLKSGVSLTGQHDSNVFLTSNNKKADYISILSPKVLFDLPMGIDSRHLFQALYAADMAAFSDYSGQNYINQNAGLNLNLILPFGYFNVNDDFKDTVDRSSTEFTDQIRRRENRAAVAVGVEINRLTYELAFANFIKRYDDSTYRTLEYNEDVVSGTVYYQLFPKTKALVQYDHGMIDYSRDASRDASYDQFMAGLRGELTDKITGTVKLGYQLRDYDDAGEQGYEGLVSETGIDIAFTERRSLTLKYISKALESVYGANNYYDAHMLSAEFQQKLKGGFSLLLGAGYARNLYPETDTTLSVKRADTVVSGKSTLRYEVKDNMRVNLGYEHKENLSNIDSKEYVDNLTSIRFDLVM